jgi:hypothetical protein
MNLTLDQIAHGIARIDGRVRANADDYRLARLGKPTFDAVPDRFDDPLIYEVVAEVTPDADDPVVNAVISVMVFDAFRDEVCR